MNVRHLFRPPPLLALLPVALTAQVSQERDIPLKNWSAPLYWQQPAQPDSRDKASQPDLSASLTSPAATSTPPSVFVAITPCRVVDTRAAAGFPGSFGPPSLFANSNRTFPIQSSSVCQIPSTALAYSFNVTAVPPGFLGFITIYPTGQAVPNASTLNSYLGTVEARRFGCGGMGTLKGWLKRSHRFRTQVAVSSIACGSSRKLPWNAIPPSFRQWPRASCFKMPLAESSCATRLQSGFSGTLSLK